MNVYHGIDNFQFEAKNILTIGTFDGVHLGHKYLLNRVIVLSKKLDGKPAVVTFEPHPQMVVNSNREIPIKIITTLDEKLEMLKAAGIQSVYVIEFNNQFAKFTSVEFIENYLKTKIGLMGIVVGFDHNFGNARKGDFETLNAAFSDEAIEVEKLDRYAFNDEIISSSTIRRLIANGEIVRANELLGYPYSIAGPIVFGDKRGRNLGFPTANLDIAKLNKIMPEMGVYAVRASIGNESYFGMANVGIRPTFAQESLSLEVNIFDFSENIYGKMVRVHFLKKIRNEVKFSNPQALIKQLQKDKTETTFFLKSTYKT
ncbi:MAG: bifunctional riboflavin kinase/FAD synthetase [Calditrichaeota bacterium]|nr:MAG: bifunctional riboflavin kinase/FAD synthetase [Calditrichota bacterium]